MLTAQKLREDPVLRTRVSPPRLHRRVLARPVLLDQLSEALDYRLTVLQAGTGYGKSTALSALTEREFPWFWYSLDETDRDPQQFLSYLLTAFRLRLPDLSEQPLAVLQEFGNQGTAQAWVHTLDALINSLTGAIQRPSVLVLDDFHFVAHSPEVNHLVERLVTYAPPDLHIVISTRVPLTWPALTRWRAQGEVLELDHRVLAFQPAEIEALFRDTYGLRLAPDELPALSEKTEGWPIALQLVWQGLRDNTSRNAAELLAHSPGGNRAYTGSPASLDTLFDYLARDVLDRQPREIATFLRESCVLRELSPAACDAVVSHADSAAMLKRLHDLNLFVVALGAGRYRYHHLFHDFLRQQAGVEPEWLHERHRRAAQFFHTEQQYEEAIYHWLAAEDFAQAARAIESAGEGALRAGRQDTVARWIDALPAEIVGLQPLLQAYLGDVYRYRSRFNDALAWYRQAEQSWRAGGDRAGVSRALRGQALVYLDTVRPAQAESLLEEALDLIDGAADQRSRARLLELLAENKLNLGRPAEAESLGEQARLLREDGPSEDALSVRVKLRTGRLDEAEKILETWLKAERSDAERGHAHPPRAHRETVLLLSLIQSFRGQSGRATTLAQEGIELGDRLSSPFISAVAHTRLGHAQQLSYQKLSALELPAPDAFTRRRRAREEAIGSYQAAIACGDRISVRRMRAEAMWGLTRAYGFFADLESARRTAEEGIEIARWAGDAWIGALIELTLNASHVLAGQAQEAVDPLFRVLLAFRDCGDPFGRTAARLWLSLAYLALRQFEHFASSVEELLTLSETHGYDFLFTTATLLGPPDPRILVPLLLAARECQRRPAYVASLLDRIGLAAIEVHPGYALRVQTLGAFRVWRGEIEVEAREWQRDKARQLFQLLLTRWGRWLQRDEIVDQLWPQLSPAAATRDFKVALNALNKALEPNRSPDAPFAYIMREGSAYRMRPEADLWLDCAEFEQAGETGLRLVASGESGPGVEHLCAAVQLYAGDYLPEALYEDWASEERERLFSLYLRAADRLAEFMLEQSRYDECLALCQQILAGDACWEHAYQRLMTAYARQGNRSQVHRVYQQCVQSLRQELDVSPSPATVAIYERSIRGCC